jgi:hypothetical protein
MTISFEHLEESFRNLWLKGFWMKKDIGRWVILKRVAVKIRSARSPLIMGRRDELKRGSFGWGLGIFWRIWVFGGWSEKGNGRKCTGNRVTSCIKVFWRNFGISRWFTKRIRMGEFWFTLFWAFGRGSAWVHWGGGTVCVSPWCLGEFSCVVGYLPVVCMGL